MWLCYSSIKWWTLMFPPLESGMACDRFHQQNMAEAMLWELRGWVIKRNTAFTLFAETCACRTPWLRPIKSLSMLSLSCCEGAKPHGEATCSLYVIDQADSLIHQFYSLRFIYLVREESAVKPEHILQKENLCVYFPSLKKHYYPFVMKNKIK